MLTFLPIYLRAVRGASPAETGLMLLPLTFGIGIGVDHHRTIRNPKRPHGGLSNLRFTRGNGRSGPRSPLA